MKQKSGSLVSAVFKDLRDRRLLPVVVVLLIAIVAVPFLIKGSDPPPVPVVDVDAAEVGGPVADPVVVTDQPGLRDYRERLQGLRSKNPFKQQLTQPLGGASQSTGGGGSADQIPTQDSAGGDAASTVTASGAPVDASEPVQAGKPPDAPSTEPAGEPEGKPRVVTFSIDVKVGPIHEARVLRDVESLTMLPDEEHPVLEYLQSSFDETGASFAISRRVVGTEGEGRCSPNRSRCEFLLLEVGEEQTFRYEPDGRTYRIKLLAVHRQERRVENRSEKRVERPAERTFPAE